MQRLFIKFLNSTGCFLLYFTLTSKASWHLSWSDEFDAESVDLTLWKFDFGDGCQITADLCGWGNQELQYYTNNSENVFLKEGQMVIKAVEHGGEFTSTRIKTKGDWAKAKIEIRAKFPSAKFINPSIWMLPSDEIYGIWPTSGGIDIAVTRNEGFEIKNGVFCGIKYGNSWDDLDESFRASLFKSENPKTFFDDFHIFTFEKFEDTLRWFVDGQKIFNVTRHELKTYYIYPFNERFHLLFSMAVGGKFSDDPTDFDAFPQLFHIDYVRVYDWTDEL